MSRLDSFIARVLAQRIILDHVREDLDIPVEGAVLEVGLGNGRTYDHLRETFTGRRIIAFDRAVGSHPASTPAPEDLVLGEIAETLPRFAGSAAAFAHADIGTAYRDVDERTKSWLPGALAAALASGGIAASGLPLDHPELKPLPVPDGVDPDRYFLYRRT
ncbi:class I SAM-dependent methyltransferase [Rhizobium sp. CC-YZS058]|uniref:class I SAM-dependent methyltransferase n=1 Tax=Rhizobium sp. CC-YZS058 TaxID=3042153 RepID=UPI002B0584FA|nr:class I SAM-dependent methyltransferase [Rhizobium sp. CC-YZS058]MEA3533970.1 class I SAM-dependent methyltransferase [Rhizobium sp. CC-YZS058]